VTIRIGILTYDFVPFIGGQGRVTHDLWRRLRERDDVDVTVISPARNDLPGHAVRFALAQRFGHHLLFSIAATAAVRRWVRDLGLDVLQVNGGPGGVLLLTDPGVPVLYSTFHTYDQVVRFTPGQRWKRTLARIERAAYRRADRIVASTPSTASAIRQTLDAPPPIDVIPCGIDLDAFRPAAVRREEQTLLFVGRLDVRKNPQLAVRAFARVAARQPDAKLVIVGRGSLEAELRTLAERLGVASRVRFERFVDQQRLVDWYRRATAVVVPSLFEGFGLSAAEAMACSACVVATDSDGLRDVITDGETGLLVPGRDDELADAILGVLAKPEHRARLGRTAAAHVRTAYAWPSITEQFVAAYYATASRAERTRIAA
jgi:D-inositol-3-phosphate glycosyltransferase